MINNDDIISETEYDFSSEQGFDAAASDKPSDGVKPEDKPPYPTEPVEEAEKDSTEEEKDPALADSAGDERKHETAEPVSEEEYDHIDDSLLDRARPSVKIPVKENHGLFLNKGMIITVIGTVVVLFAVVFGIIVPGMSKKKKKENPELDKAGSIYIPDTINRWQPKKTETENRPADDNDMDGIFKKLPEADTGPQNTAPVETPESSGSRQSGSVSSRPETNRNEQQKEMLRLSLDSNPLQPGSSGKSYRYGSAASTYTAAPEADSYVASANERMKNMMSLAGRSMNGADSYSDQNNQSGKLGFANSGTDGAGQYKWNTAVALDKGTDIPAVLETDINTDLPGIVKARVTSNVYSSQDGNYLIIPEGTKLLAVYNSSISYAQNRVQVAWNTMIRPDGLEVNLGNVQGTDSRGAAGYTGHKSGHPFEYAKAFGLIAMFSIIDTKFENQIDTANNQYAQNVLSDTYAATKQINNKILNRALDIQPTIKIKSGTIIHLITNTTMELPPAEMEPVAQKYVRY